MAIGISRDDPVFGPRLMALRAVMDGRGAELAVISGGVALARLGAPVGHAALLVRAADAWALVPGEAWPDPRDRGRSVAHDGADGGTPVLDQFAPRHRLDLSDDIARLVSPWPA